MQDATKILGANAKVVVYGFRDGKLLLSSMNNIPRILVVCFLIALPLLPINALADNQGFKFLRASPLIQLPPPDEMSHYKWGYTFSHNNQLLAVYQLGEEVAPGYFEGSTIKIWDAKNGELKYSTQLPRHQDASEHRSAPIVFSSDDQMIIRADGKESDMFIWPFTQTQSVQLLCSLGNFNDNQQLKAISDNQQLFLVTGVEYESLCIQGHEKVSLQKLATQDRLGANSKVLYENKLLIIHNIRKQAKTPFNLRNPLSKAQLRFIDLWNLDYYSKANHWAQLVDENKQLFILLEFFKGQVRINQWNYASRQWLSEQLFDDIPTALLDYQWLYAYLTEHYLLICSKDQLIAFNRQDDNFFFLWSKQVPGIKYLSKVQFSLDEQLIIVGDLSLQHSDQLFVINAETGELVYHYKDKLDDQTRMTKERFYVLSPLMKNNPKQYLDFYTIDQHTSCPLGVKTTLYDLTIGKLVQSVDGAVLAMSPNGNSLLVCKENSLWLLNKHP